MHLPTPVHVSKYYFLKDVDKFKAEEKFFCEFCQSLLNAKDDDSEKFTCTTVHCPKKDEFYSVKELKKKGCFFLRIPLKDQLLMKLNNDSFFASLQRNTDEGICGGDTYQKLREEGIIGDEDITVQFNTDGASAFESSLDSIWPLLVTINELPVPVRKKNVMLTCLWFGKKPEMNTFLAPFVEEMTDLHENGLTLKNGKKIKVHCLLSTVDSVARPYLQSIQQHNAHFGCSYCLLKGQTLWITEKKKTHIYEGQIGTPRTEEQHIEDAKKTMTNPKKPTHGVTGISVLMFLPLFNIFTSMFPDYMHNILLGVVRQFLFGWLDSKYSSKEWYLNNRKKEALDRRILNMTPPDEITRILRSLLYRKKYKASELRTFLLHYSLPCLNGILPPKYVKHWSLLVYSVSIFLKEKIEPQDWESAKEAMEKFVSQTGELYPKEWLTFNLHLLLHVPDFVKRYGGLWDSSCFTYEHYNGILVKLFHGSQHVARQIFKNYCRLQYIQKTIWNKRIFENCHPAALTLLKDFCNKYVILPRGLEGRFQNDPVVHLGAHEVVRLNAQEVIAVRVLLPLHYVVNTATDNIRMWKRCIIKKIKCSSVSYDRAPKRKNSYVQLNDGTFFEIEKIINIFGYDVFTGQLLTVEALRFRSKDIKNKTVLPSLIIGRQKNAIFPQSVKRKCVYMRVPGDNESYEEFISPLPNNYERD